jgi:glycosyltransferase involved in cell wall biosynthesis
MEKRISAMRERGFTIHTLGHQPSSIFYELMRRATVFAFPSRYEGFGLPPLEAMHLGTPVVTSTAGALPETCGEAAVQVRPEDVEGLANALSRLLKSPEERSARSAAGRRWAASYTWRNAAGRTIEVYRATLATSLPALHVV